MNLFLISKSVFSLSRYIFTCWHFHFLRIARTAAVACYLPYHQSSPFQIVPLHYFLLENLNVFAPFKISIPFSRKHSESLSQTNEHLHAKLFLSPPPPLTKQGLSAPPKLEAHPTPHPTPCQQSLASVLLLLGNHHHHSYTDYDRHHQHPLSRL